MPAPFSGIQFKVVADLSRVKKLLKTICEPETIIEDYQHR